MRIPYSWLLDYLKTDVPAEQLAEILTMGGLEIEEVQDWTSDDGKATDKVLYSKLTANRGDLLSMVGVARHAAALLECEWIMPPVSRPEVDTPTVGAPLVQEGDVKVEVLDLNGCSRYSAMAVRDVKIGPSPDWMRYRLEAAGMRPISNIVDVTNYVCWELGQPLHAFDLRLLARNHVIVRRANAGEKLKLINDSVIDLNLNDLMICDEMGPVALAGVMGGSETEVNERTKMVLIESAHFDPVSVRHSSTRHNLGSEASYRFERFVDPNLTLPALARATQLLLETTGGTADPVALDVREAILEPLHLTLRPTRCNQILGSSLNAEDMTSCLTRLGFTVTTAEENLLNVTVPTFRPDVEREIDLIEEVAIVYGYNNLPRSRPARMISSGVLSPRQKAERKARELLRQCGLDETMGFSFMGVQDLDRCGFAPNAPERDALALAMPMSADLSHLRTTLIPGLLNACAGNIRQRILDVSLYEVERVYLLRKPGMTDLRPRAPHDTDDLPIESVRIAGILTGLPMVSVWNLPDEIKTVDFYWLKGILEQFLSGMNLSGVEFTRCTHPTFHTGRCAQIMVKGECLGIMGEVATAVQNAYDIPQKAYLFELDFEVLLKHAAAFRTYDPLPRFPAAYRDIALVMDDDEAHSAAALGACIREAAGDYIDTVEAFDLFIDPQRLGAGRKSLAFRMTFRAQVRTLTDEELDEAMADITKSLSEQFNAQVRDR